jgi:hypothetical protein
MKLFPAKYWIVLKMSRKFVPLLVQWTSRIAPGRQLDMEFMIAHINENKSPESTRNTREYFVGLYDDQPAFFMNGYLSEKIGYYPGNKGIRRDYYLDLVVGSALFSLQDLYLQSWHQGLKFLFSRPDIRRVMVRSASLNSIEREAMRRIGFKEMEYHQNQLNGIQYLVCRRSDFLGILHF